MMNDSLRLPRNSWDDRRNLNKYYFQAKERPCGVTAQLVCMSVVTYTSVALQTSQVFVVCVVKSITPI